MRKTRSSSRVPLQTISTQNHEKMKKDLQPEQQKTEKEEDIKGIKVEPDVMKQNICFTELKVLSGKRKSSPAVVDPPAKLLKVEKESDKEESSESEEEVDYEEMRQRNLRDNQAFFSMLGIDKAKERLHVSAQKKFPKSSVKRERKTPEVLPRRKSLRIQRIDPAGQPLPPEPEPEPFVNEHPRVPAGPVNMVDVMESAEEDYGIVASALSGLTKDRCQWKPLSEDLARFVSDMKKMSISTKAKACKDRLFSVALHPANDRVLAMAGDKWGRLGFWDISATNQDSSVVTFRPHSRPIGHIVVPPSAPHTVYTCSYDATLRSGHIERGVFEELYSVPEEEDDLFRSFDFLSPSSLLLAQFRGDVAVLDTRTPGQRAEKVYRVCDKYLRTVSVHPSCPNIFITAGTDMKVSVWDLRKLSSKGSKPLHFLTHGRAVSSAYFSPLTGRHILSCSADDTLNIYNCSSSCGEVTRAKTVSHNNKTGRWLTPFRAVWHPAREDVFFVGSMKSPRRMEAFGADGRLLHEFQGDILSSVCSVVQFHPSQNVLVGGNSSGYIFPFM
ncbi:WD repeat-containing protein 76-like [Babylonia areolata]|uniref:WD repeat-containing protein 76-like n=1 Tax=Babylonia areolata TaxID=304850 RepID=UPI003FD3AC7D